MEWMTDLIANEQNILLLDDFNIHVNDGCDEDSRMFRETIDGLGLQQHVNFSTHTRQLPGPNHHRNLQ